MIASVCATILALESGSKLNGDEVAQRKVKISS